jgi:hypothetical protein
MCSQQKKPPGKASKKQLDDDAPYVEGRKSLFHFRNVFAFMMSIKTDDLFYSSAKKDKTPSRADAMRAADEVLVK